MPWHGVWRHGSMRYHAYAKTNSIRNRDKAQFGRSDLKLADTIELALRSDGKCAACGCILLFEKFKPRCFYQWSLDRITAICRALRRKSALSVATATWVGQVDGNRRAG